jgi:Zn-dependent M28 family amino/carboxypeptidase
VFFGAEEVGLLGSRYYVYGLTDTDHENLLFMVNADVLISGIPLYHAGFNDNGVPGANAVTAQMDDIANDINDYYGIEFFSWPEGIYNITDHIPFLMTGHSIIFLASITGTDITIGDNEVDNWDFINETFPGMIESNMRYFSIFLENLLLSKW